MFSHCGVAPADTTWNVDDSSKLTGDRYFIGSATAEERVRLISIASPTQIVVERGYQSSTAGNWAGGVRMKKISPVSGFASDVEWGCTISNILVTGDGSLKVGGDAARIEESDSRCKYTGFWEDYKYGAVRRGPRSGGASATASAPRQRTHWTSGRCPSATRRRTPMICIWGRS